MVGLFVARLFMARCFGGFKQFGKVGSMRNSSGVEHSYMGLCHGV